MAGMALHPIVLVRGSGDVGSAVAHGLFAAGYRALICDVQLPAAPRRGMAFADAIFDGGCVLEGLEARRVDAVADLRAAVTERGAIAVSTAEIAAVLDAVAPAVLVDARMRKRARPERQRDLAPLTLGLGPGFVAGETVDLAIETQWGEHLGDVLQSGATRQLEGEPRSFADHGRERFVYAPLAGVMRTRAQIAQHVHAGEPVATIAAAELVAPLDGILRGLTHDGVPVEAGTKVLEVDPRGDPKAVIGIGKRPRRIAEGVLGAIESRAAAIQAP